VKELFFSPIIAEISLPKETTGKKNLMMGKKPMVKMDIKSTPQKLKKRNLGARVQIGRLLDRKLGWRDRGRQRSRGIENCIRGRRVRDNCKGA
jgi:hypothetical protein